MKLFEVKPMEPAKGYKKDDYFKRDDGTLLSRGALRKIIDKQEEAVINSLAGKTFTLFGEPHTIEKITAGNNVIHPWSLTDLKRHNILDNYNYDMTFYVKFDKEIPSKKLHDARKDEDIHKQIAKELINSSDLSIDVKRKLLKVAKEPYSASNEILRGFNSRGLLQHDEHALLYIPASVVDII